MAGTTISGGHVSGITLTGAGDNPAYIAANGVINTATGSAIYGPSGTTWTVSNAGSLIATNAGGIKLAAGGDVTNTASGSIRALYGVEFAKNNTAGTVLNAGYVSASSVGVSSYYDLLLNNAAGGSISGFYGVWTGGPFRGGGAGMVTNAGQISATEYGVYLERGGTVTNQIHGQITATGTGYDEIGVKGANGTAITVINDGTISATRNIAVPPAQKYHSAYGVELLDGGGSVTNQVNGLIIGQSTNAYTRIGGVVSVGFATLSNAGTIRNGVSLLNGGIVTNAATGLMTKEGFSIDVLAIKGISIVSTVENFGTIDGGTYATPIAMASLGNVTNEASGVLTGGYGVNEIYGAGVRTSGIAAIVTNAGTIHSRSHGVNVFGRPGAVTNQTGATIDAGRVGVQLVAGGSVVNQAGAVINGIQAGVAIYNAAGTITNAGTIISTGTSSPTGHFGAVVFGAGFADRLVIDPGAVITGGVDGGNTIGASVVSTVELAAGTAAGTVTGFGTQFVDFGAIAIDPGASWLIGGDTVGLGGTISGFRPGDTIDLTGFAAAGKTFAANVLTLTGATTETLNLPGGYVTANFTVVPDGAGGTFITVACFAAGARILTVRGEVAVELLREGDLVQTLRGGALAPVRWIGHRHLDLRRHPRPWEVHPVRIGADAFAPGMPHADLLVSADHAIFVGGVLIPARYLLNGATVVRQPVNEISYFHVELAGHEVLLANGLPAESYLDTGNRGDFGNGGPAVHAHPEFARAVWSDLGCAPLVQGGPHLVAAREELLRRAGELGFVSTDVPDLRITIDGTPAAVPGGGDCIRLPPGARIVRIGSRRWCPAEMRADGCDARVLGVAVGEIALDGAAVEVTDPRLCDGWHDAEAAQWRWTDGDAALEVSGAATLRFTVALSGTYWDDPLAKTADRSSVRRNS